MMLFLDTKIVRFSFIRTLSAYNLRYDVFKVTKLLPIRETNLLFAVNEGYGVHIINMTLAKKGGYPDVRDCIIGNLDMINHIKFQD
jgi:hypothetical protein